jgi:hypothetical protein
MRLIFLAMLFAGIHSSHAFAQQNEAVPPSVNASEQPLEQAPKAEPIAAPKMPVAVPAAVSGPCQNPLSATRNWLDHLQDKTRDTAAAIECTEQGKLSVEQREQAVIQLKKVFDVRGLFLHFEDIPTSNEYIDQSSGRHRYTLAEVLPAVFLEKKDNIWVFPVSVLRQANGLYEEALPLDVMRLVPGLPSWMLVPIFGIQGFTIWQLTLLVFILLIGLIVRTIVGHLITGQVKRATKKLGWLWGEDVIHLAALPLGTLSMAGVLAIGVPALQLPVKLSAVAMIAVRTLAAVAVVLLLYRTVDLLAAWMLSKAQESDTKLDD